MIFLIFLIQQCYGHNHKHPRIVLVTDWTLQPCLTFLSCEEQTLINAIFKVLKEIFRKSFVYFWIRSGWTDAVLDFVGFDGFIL